MKRCVFPCKLGWRKEAFTTRLSQGLTCLWLGVVRNEMRSSGLAHRYLILLSVISISSQSELIQMAIVAKNRLKSPNFMTTLHWLVANSVPCLLFGGTCGTNKLQIFPFLWDGTGNWEQWAYCPLFFFSDLVTRNQSEMISHKRVMFYQKKRPGNDVIGVRGNPLFLF